MSRSVYEDAKRDFELWKEDFIERVMDREDEVTKMLKPFWVTNKTSLKVQERMLKLIRNSHG